MRRRAGLFGGLILANAAAWLWAWSAFAGRPVLLGTALLAWVFGLRHAVDADHIAAIDNVVRKLMQAGRRPVTVGLWFSLGHSTVVILAALVVALAAVELDGAKEIGATLGTVISGVFLLVIALANLVILRGVWASFRAVRRGETLDEHALELLLNGRGLLARLLRPVFSAVSREWHLYPIGFLFGLGFDTATEIGLLGISASQAAQGMSPWQTMVFPALFTAGMALVDTADSALMVGAYGWAFVKPMRKLWYNLTITAASVLVALLIGGVEVLGLLGDRFALTGPFWEAIGSLNDNFGVLGYAVIGVFAATWGVSAAIYRWKRLDAA
jgi:high-affinity nickel-transport protein